MFANAQGKHDSEVNSAGARQDATINQTETQTNSLWQSLAFSPIKIQPKLAVSQPHEPLQPQVDAVADAVMKQPPLNSLWESMALDRGRLQPKLEVSQPADPYEQEADQVAERVMRMPELQSIGSTASLTELEVQRKCGPCEEEEEQELRRKHDGGGSDSSVAASAIVNHALSSAGQPLDETTRGFMEQRFGRDLSNVRIHTDSHAAESARAVNAMAYTVGNHVAFASGQYVPATVRGKTLLAHELTHTLQQNPGSTKVIQRQPTPLDLLLEGIGQLPPARTEDFCTAWPTLDEARRVRQIAIRNFLPALSARFGPDVEALWRLYLNRQHGASLARRVFSNASHPIPRAFAQSQTIRDRQTFLMGMLEDWFRRTCPSLPASFPMSIPASNIFPATELDFPINFNVPTEVPGNIAGGVGSSDAGPDTRSMSGSIVFFRSVDAAGHTTAVRARSELQFVVRDAIDFCPGDPGTGMEQLLTIPLSRLEKSGEVWPGEVLAYDVPIEVRFTGDAVSADISAQALRTCDPQARPPSPPETPRPVEPPPTPTPEEPGREPIFRKAISNEPDNSQSTSRAAQVATDHNAQSLEPNVRRQMETALGIDLRRVRIHTGAAAAASAEEIGARAYTLGRDVVFGSGEFAPHTNEGRRVLAHELAHVAQQSEHYGARPVSDLIQRQRRRATFAQIYPRAVAEVGRRWPAMGQMLRTAGAPGSGYRLIRRFSATQTRLGVPVEVFLRITTAVTGLGQVAEFGIDAGDPMVAPRMETSITIDDNQVTDGPTLTRSLYHEMVHLLLYLDNISTTPTYRISGEFNRYLARARTLPLYGIILNDILAFMVWPDPVSSLQPGWRRLHENNASDVLSDVLQEKFTHRAETQAFGRVATTPRNRTLASAYVRHFLQPFDSPPDPNRAPNIGVITSRVEALLDELDRVSP